MKKTSFTLLAIFFANLMIANQIVAETTFDFYINDFYNKSNEARQILKEIEITLKKGSRSQVCARQREAAKLGLLANKSLIKAFEVSDTETSLEVIKTSEKRSVVFLLV